MTPASRPENGEWSGWQPLAGMPPLRAEVLAETLDGGQAFRWRRIELAAESVGVGDGDGAPSPRWTDAWLGIWGHTMVRLRCRVDGTLAWSAPAAMVPRTPAALAEYFGTERNFAALTDSLPWRSDPHLADCIGAFRGLRILKQPFGETLLGFLCSATKQIVQIKQMVALLAERHGAPLVPVVSSTPVSTVVPVAERVSVSLPHVTTSPPSSPVPPVIHRLPTWPELAHVPETELRACLLGFRARYIAETARFLAARPGWLEETESLPYAVAKERLCSLRGVGEKVADCVLLFGAGRLEAFPVDVWILRTLALRYGLEGWRPAQLTQFGRAHFGPLAGLAQQFLFAWERQAAKATRPVKPSPSAR